MLHGTIPVVPSAQSTRMALFGILLALGLLIWLAYRGVSVIVLAPLMAAVAAGFSLQPILASYTQVFMPAAGQFVITFLPLFLLGAIFGRLMEDSGLARALAGGIVRALGRDRAIPAVVAACALLTYGGVSLFVVVFAIYPVAAALFRSANISRRLIPATIALGAFTFTMTALPGTPAIQNAIPMPHFGTTAFAAPGLGLIAAAIMAGGGLLWLSRRRQVLVAEGYGSGCPSEPAPVAQPDTDIGPIEKPQHVHAATGGAVAALAPIVLVIALNYLFSVQIIPRLDTQHLALPEFGATTVDSVRGLWSVILSLLAAICLILAMSWRQLAEPVDSIGKGGEAALLPIFNTASLVGFGAVVAGLPAFTLVQQAVESLGGGPVVSLAVSTSVLSALTGSASGGMSIALDAVGASYLAQAQALGISPDLLHRVTTLATGGLDALPHNGAVVTLLSICGLTHRDSYGDIFMVAVAIPVAALVAVVVLGLTLGSF